MFFTALVLLGKQYCKFKKSTFEVIVLRLPSLNNHSIHQHKWVLIPNLTPEMAGV